MNAKQTLAVAGLTSMLVAADLTAQDFAHFTGRSLVESLVAVGAPKTGKLVKACIECVAAADRS